jgi:hypothetical protein
MTTLPVADGAHLLGIHPKTLHHWLNEAQVPLAVHPTDARIKCVAEEDLHQVAKLHGRPFPSAVPLDAASAPLVAAQGRVPRLSENEVEPTSTACSLLTPSGSEADLIQKLADLETKIVTLQEQFAQLALTLLQARERSVEHRLTALESLLHQLLGRQMPNPPAPEPRQEPACAVLQPRALHPAEQGARSRRPPLIEYSAPGIYVIISAQEGEVHLEPNSRAWFDWLATLSSFRFIGPVGRTTRPSRLQAGPADALLVGFSLCAPSYLQALSWHDGVFDACQSGAHCCQTPS